MTESDNQWEFLQDVASLILFARHIGYKLSGGELYRTEEQQKIYVQSGLSKTMNSMHLRRMAIDFNIFYDYDGDGDKDYINTDEEFEAIGKVLGDYWKSLNPELNESGFDWGWDRGHFERRV